MSVFKRSILLFVGLSLVVASLPYVVHKGLYPHVSQIQMIFNITVGSIVAIYNFLMIYKRATTVHVVVDSEEINERIMEKKGEKDYD